MDNDGDYIGVPFEPSSAAWIRVVPPRVHKGDLLIRKKGKFGIWKEKYRYWTIQWFGAEGED